MPRLNVGHLGRPPHRFRPSIHSRGFETVQFARAQDNLRASVLLTALETAPPEQRAKRKRLARHQLRKLSKRKRRSPASSLDMRYFRERILGQLYHRIYRTKVSIVFFDLVPSTWVVKDGELHTVDPRRLLQQLRSDLNRCGAKSADGAFFAVLHGEYDPTNKIYCLHAHCVAWGGMVDVADRLRKRRKYRHNPDALRDGVGAVNPVVATNNVKDVAYRLTYLMKSYWPKSPTFKNRKGQDRRWEKTQGLDRKQLIEVLLWHDRFEIADLCLMLKLQVGKTGFESTEKRTPNREVV